MACFIIRGGNMPCPLEALIKLFYSLLFAFFLIAHARAEALPPSVREALLKADVPESAVSIVVQEVNQTRPLLHLNEAWPMNPASTMKLLTTFAGLELLSPAYQWKTEAYLDGRLENGVLQGDFVLKGYGDPKFTIEQFWLWLAELRARGLREIRGDLLLDRRFFELPPGSDRSFDSDTVRAYNVSPDALLLNFNTLHLRYRPENGRLRAIVEPPIDGIIIDNQLVTKYTESCDNWDDTILVQATDERLLLQGGYPAECGEREHNLSVLSHTRYVEAVFRAVWQQLGGSFSGKVRDGVVRQEAQLFATHRSEPLSQLIRDINKFSNNVMARQLFLTLTSAGEPAAIASIPRSSAAMRDWLTKKGLDFPELVLENGSGLSHQERISTAHMAQLLQSVTESPFSAELVASLPILGVDGSVKKRLKTSPAASHAHLKTGTLDGVKTLAGFVQARSGKQWIVVFFINHPNAKRAQAAQDALIEWVQGS